MTVSYTRSPPGLLPRPAADPVRGRRRRGTGAAGRGGRRARRTSPTQTAWSPSSCHERTLALHVGERARDEGQAVAALEEREALELAAAGRGEAARDVLLLLARGRSPRRARCRASRRWRRSGGRCTRARAAGAGSRSRTSSPSGRAARRRRRGSSRPSRRTRTGRGPVGTTASRRSPAQALAAARAARRGGRAAARCARPRTASKSTRARSWRATAGHGEPRVDEREPGEEQQRAEERRRRTGRGPSAKRRTQKPALETNASTADSRSSRTTSTFACEDTMCTRASSRRRPARRPSVSGERGPLGHGLAGEAVDPARERRVQRRRRRPPPRARGARTRRRRPK